MNDLIILLLVFVIGTICKCMTHKKVKEIEGFQGMIKKEKPGQIIAKF
ncbi:MAG: hypothetical protein RR602_07595 [Longicatena sp.]